MQEFLAEESSWGGSSNFAERAFNSPLKWCFTSARGRYNGEIGFNETGWCWTSNSSNSNEYAYAGTWTNDFKNVTLHPKATGVPVRLILDEAYDPNYSGNIPI